MEFKLMYTKFYVRPGTNDSIDSAIAGATEPYIFDMGGGRFQHDAFTGMYFTSVDGVIEELPVYLRDCAIDRIVMTATNLPAHKVGAVAGWYELTLGDEAQPVRVVANVELSARSDRSGGSTIVAKHIQMTAYGNPGLEALNRYMRKLRRGDEVPDDPAEPVRSNTADVPEPLVQVWCFNEAPKELQYSVGGDEDYIVLYKYVPTQTGAEEKRVQGAAKNLAESLGNRTTLREYHQDGFVYRYFVVQHA